MKTRNRLIFLITTAILLFLIACSEMLNYYEGLVTAPISVIKVRRSFGNISHNADAPFTSTSCEDLSSDCAFYNDRLNLCSDIDATRKMGCYKTCNICDVSLTPVSDKAGFIPVLIASYMRSGSTFTASVISSYPSSYYLFEPIKKSVEKMEKNLPIELVNGTTISTINNGAFLAAEFLHGLLTCQYDGLDREALNKLIGTQSTTPFRICLKRRKKNEQVLQSCLKILQKHCESSKLRVVKTIRVRMRKTVDILLKKIPGLKVIHLFRDQRPRLLSAEATPLMLATTLVKTARMECKDAADDIAIQRVLKKRHPRQIATLLYERLAENPIRIAMRIFDFIGLSLPEESVKSIKNMTSSSKEVECAFCVEKRDSAKTANAWRTKSKQNFIKIKMIEEECKTVQEALGYLPLQNMDQLRNTSISLRIDTPFTADGL
ncbi:carbohydrate sulfotransferase 2-like [Argopecten irradians]|uniref:carbohydrate sulfotransferase 2-like n=1 Tax=Argopecten irradians TaxID=31199 RepID=UPI00371500F3